MIRKHIVFYGRVQGVGFRFYAVNKARQLGLTGWVENRYDGAVEMEVQGPESGIDELVCYLDGQRFIRIEAMDVKRQSVIDEYDFVERGY